MLFHTSFACCSSSAASALLGIQLWSPCDRALWGKKKKGLHARPALTPTPRARSPAASWIRGALSQVSEGERVPLQTRQRPRVSSPPDGLPVALSCRPAPSASAPRRPVSPARPPGLAASGLASRLISLLPPPVHARRAAPRPQTARDSECRMTGCHGAGRLREPRPGSPGSPACQGTGRLPLPCADSPTRTCPET